MLSERPEIEKPASHATSEVNKLIEKLIAFTITKTSINIAEIKPLVTQFLNIYLNENNIDNFETALNDIKTKLKNAKPKQATQIFDFFETELSLQLTEHYEKIYLMLKNAPGEDIPPESKHTFSYKIQPKETSYELTILENGVKIQTINMTKKELIQVKESGTKYSAKLGEGSITCVELAKIGYILNTPSAIPANIAKNTALTILLGRNKQNDYTNHAGWQLNPLRQSQQYLTIHECAKRLVKTQTLVNRFAENETLSRETTVWEKIRELFLKILGTKKEEKKAFFKGLSKVNMFASVNKKIQADISSLTINPETIKCAAVA